MIENVTLKPVGVVRNSVVEPVDDIWGGVESRIELDVSQFSPDCLDGLNEFSHVEIVFAFHKVSEAAVEYGSRHPRGRADWPRAGIFAQRAKNRPNRLGVTVCRLLAVDGLCLRVRDLDAIDGTPVIDIKGYMLEFSPKGPVRQPEWATELMRHYWETAPE